MSSSSSHKTKVKITSLHEKKEEFASVARESRFYEDQIEFISKEFHNSLSKMRHLKQEQVQYRGQCQEKWKSITALKWQVMEKRRIVDKLRKQRKWLQEAAQWRQQVGYQWNSNWIWNQTKLEVQTSKIATGDLEFLETTSNKKEKDQTTWLSWWTDRDRWSKQIKAWCEGSSQLKGKLREQLSWLRDSNSGGWRGTTQSQTTQRDQDQQMWQEYDSIQARIRFRRMQMLDELQRVFPIQNVGHQSQNYNQQIIGAGSAQSWQVLAQQQLLQSPGGAYQLSDIYSTPARDRDSSWSVISNSGSLNSWSQNQNYNQNQQNQIQNSNAASPQSFSFALSQDGDIEILSSNSQQFNKADQNTSKLMIASSPNMLLTSAPGNAVSSSSTSTSWSSSKTTAQSNIQQQQNQQNYLQVIGGDQDQDSQSQSILSVASTPIIPSPTPSSQHSWWKQNQNQMQQKSNINNQTSQKTKRNLMIRNIPLPSIDVLQRQDLREHDAIATWLGFLWQVLFFICKYSDIPLKYRLCWGGTSKSFLREAQNMSTLATYWDMGALGQDEDFYGGLQNSIATSYDAVVGALQDWTWGLQQKWSSQNAALLGGANQSQVVVQRNWDSQLNVAGSNNINAGQSNAHHSAQSQSQLASQQRLKNKALLNMGFGFGFNSGVFSISSGQQTLTSFPFYGAISSTGIVESPLFYKGLANVWQMSSSSSWAKQNAKDANNIPDPTKDLGGGDQVIMEQDQLLWKEQNEKQKLQQVWWQGQQQLQQLQQSKTNGIISGAQSSASLASNSSNKTPFNEALNRLVGNIHQTFYSISTQQQQSGNSIKMNNGGSGQYGDDVKSMASVTHSPSFEVNPNDAQVNDQMTLNQNLLHMLELLWIRTGVQLEPDPLVLDPLVLESFDFRNVMT